MKQVPFTPNLILHNGRIYTVDADQPWAAAIAIRDQQIIAVGGDADVLALADSTTTMLDLQGKLVLPGLCDAHIHFLEWSQSQNEVPLADCTSQAEMLQRIGEWAAAAPPTAWITGRGWNESRWGVSDFPTASDLDTVTGPTQPALFWRADMHCAIANHAALRLAAVNAQTPNPPGGVIDRDAAGEPNGILRELAIGLVAQHIPKLTGQAVDPVLARGIRKLHQWGITAIHDQRMKDHDDGPRTLSALQRLHENKQLQLRVACNIAAHMLPEVTALGLRGGFGDDTLRLGHVKVFSDGSLGSRTAWMLAPFAKQAPHEADNYGVVLTLPEQMAAEFRQAIALGFPVSVHAIGDRANRVVLDIFEELQAESATLRVPHRIEHAQTLDPADLPRFAQLGITASVQPIHCTDDMDTADLLLGERGALMYRFRGLQESGARLALGSDAPVADANPFLGFHAALFRQRAERMDQPAWYAAEQLTLEQIIYGYTLGAAQAVGWDATIGSLQPGKRADLIVLDRNLFDLVAQGVRGSEVAETQVLLTMFDGQIVYRGPESA